MDLLDTNWLNQLQLAVEALIAGALGAAIGFERELARRPAGLRTHAILAATTALLVGISELLIDHFDNGQADFLNADPIRIVEAIVTGVAFLGAGTIFRHRDEDVIEGLTTAASLLLVATVGVAVALGQLLLAVVVTGVTFVLLRVGRKL
jgi:putative Mg2+ transporter-C (MgtC) family protein